MKAIHLSLCFVLLGACAASAPTTAGGDDSGGDDGGGGGDDGGGGTTPLSPEGTFALTSDYDLATNMPGTAGTVINEMIDATDSPDDPSAYVVGKLIDALPDGSIKNFLSSSAPFVTGYLNDRLFDIAPDFVQRVVDIGDKFGQLAHHFGLMETLVIDAQGHAKHTITGLHFKVDNIDLEYAFHDYDMADITVDGITASLDATGHLSLSNHAVALSYGKVLRIALDQAVIPLIDPSATDLSDVLHNAVDCATVGEYVYDAIGFGSASTYENACDHGLTAAANLVYSEIDAIDSSALSFGQAGAAKGVDSNHDGKMDKILTGKWTGTLTYATSPAPLGAATFNGTRAN